MIKTPMDLGTIKKKMVAQAYPTIFACHDDVRLVWNNCMTYNQDGSDFYLLAQTLSKKWNERFQKLVSDFGLGQEKTLSQQSTSSSSNTMMMSLEEKRAFAKLLYKLTKEELGTILVNLDHKCPSAIIKNVTEDEVELNVDQITPPIFTELMKYANECVATRIHSKNKTSTTATTGSNSQTTMTKPGVKKQKLG